jgi:drug/metabolite transporter (DMT)-like permease
MSPVSAGGVALAGNFLLSLGMVLQKRHVGWIGAKGERGAHFRRDRTLWLAGFALMNLAPVFNYLALLGLPPNVVGAAAGSNVAFTALLASVLLGERLGGRRLAWSGLLFAAIAVAALRGGSGPDRGFSPGALYVFAAIPVAVAASVLAIRASRGGSKGLAVCIAAVAGSFGGFMILPMRALQLEAGSDALRWLATPYIYLYLIGGIGGFSIVQVAYKDGEMASVSPAYYGMQVLWPALASYFVFGAPLDAIQAAAFVAIALCVVFIARG